MLVEGQLAGADGAPAFGIDEDRRSAVKVGQHRRHVLRARVPQRARGLRLRRVDLDPLTVQHSLQRIQLKVAPNLETLDGAERFPTLTSLKIAAARKLHGLDALGTASPTLREPSLRGWPRLDQDGQEAELHRRIRHGLRSTPVPKFEPAPPCPEVAVAVGQRSPSAS